MHDTQPDDKKPMGNESTSQAFTEIHCRRCGSDRGLRYGYSDSLGNASIKIRCASCGARVPNRRQGESGLLLDERDRKDKLRVVVDGGETLQGYTEGNAGP